MNLKVIINLKTKNMYTLKQKKKLLSDLFILEYKLGYSILDRIGKPYSYFNFDLVAVAVDRLKKEHIEVEGYEFEGEYIV